MPATGRLLIGAMACRRRIGATGEPESNDGCSDEYLGAREGAAGWLRQTGSLQLLIRNRFRLGAGKALPNRWTRAQRVHRSSVQAVEYFGAGSRLLGQLEAANDWNWSVWNQGAPKSTLGLRVLVHDGLITQTHEDGIMRDLELNADEVVVPAADEKTTAEPLYVHLTLSDPDVVAAVSEYEGATRKEFIELCMRVGVQAVRAARGLVDGEAIRKSGESLLMQLHERLDGFREVMGGQLSGVLASYFDPTSGSFNMRVRSLVENDGELERVVRLPIQQERERLQATIEALIGPDGRLTRLLGAGEDNEFVKGLRGQLQELLNVQEQRVVQQFSLDDEASALSRLVRELRAGHGDLTDSLSKRLGDVVAEFSLDRQDSALSRLVLTITKSQEAISADFSLDKAGSALHRLKQEIQTSIDEGQAKQRDFHEQMLSMMGELRGRKAAEKASTTHGAEFEKRVGDKVREVVGASGDVLEDCGTTTGTIRASKVGDFVLTMAAESAAAGARIVVEAKESASYNLKSTLEECDEARRNRSADVCVFVHSRATAPEHMDLLRRYGHDIVLVWDAEDPASDVVLRAGLELAKGLSVRRALHANEDKASYQAIDKAIEVLRKQFEGIEELKTFAQTAEKGAQKMQDRLRIMGEQSVKSLETLTREFGKVRHDTEGGEGGIA